MDAAEKQTVTITAVAADGYTFYKWSDGLTTATRVDSATKDISVTAMFNDARVQINLDQGESTIKQGESLTINASVTLGGKSYDNSGVQWSVNDDLMQNGASYTFTPNATGDYRIKAGLEGLAGQIPGLLEVHVYTDALPSSANADLMLDTTFTDEAALKGYAVHPAHVAVADGKVRPYTAVRTCLDFTV